ncbi:MAG: hypothetical protein RR224_00590 [Clostridia bacterium]
MASVKGLDGEVTSLNGRRIETKNRTLTTEYAFDAAGNLTRQKTKGRTELFIEYV